MDEQDFCNIELGLGLGVGDYALSKKVLHDQRSQKDKSVVCLDLSFTLCTTKELDHANKLMDHHHDTGDEECGNYRRIDRYSIKEDTENYCDRKKLKLTKEQSTLLENSFKQHTTLNPAQKQALAEQLNLKPRQVEVWFQNRRARTKLKQTVADYEVLKRWCENLSEENKKLKKDLQELRSLKPPAGRSSSASAMYLNLPTKASNLTTCPTCDKTALIQEQKNVAVFEVVHNKK